MIEELLVPLDGMTRSLDALRVAAPLAARLGAALSAAIVCDPHLDAMEDVEWLERHTDELGMELGRSVVVPADDTVATLLELADEVPGSFLCMSSHGRSGVGQAVLGSVSAAVVRASTKPVVLIGPHAVPPSSFAAVEVCLDGSPIAERALASAREWSDALGAALWPVTVEDHDAARMLVKRAESLEAALIVAATHGRSGLSGVVLGSVAAGIVREATCPVLLVGPAVKQEQLAA